MNQRRHGTVPMWFVVTLTVVGVTFAGLVALWMYWLAGAFLPAV